MTHRKGAVWTERLVLALILASLAGTLNLVLAVHRRVHLDGVASQVVRRPPPGPLVTSAALQAAHSAPPPPSPPQTPVDPRSRSTPPPAAGGPHRADPGADGSGHRPGDRGRPEADRARDGDGDGPTASVAESERWKRREMLVRQQVAT